MFLEMIMGSPPRKKEKNPSCISIILRYLLRSNFFFASAQNDFFFFFSFFFSAKKWESKTFLYYTKKRTKTHAKTYYTVRESRASYKSKQQRFIIQFWKLQRVARVFFFRVVLWLLYISYYFSLLLFISIKKSLERNLYKNIFARHFCSLT